MAAKGDARAATFHHACLLLSPAACTTTHPFPHLLLPPNMLPCLAFSLSFACLTSASSLPASPSLASLSFACVWRWFSHVHIGADTAPLDTKTHMPNKVRVCVCGILYVYRYIPLFNFWDIMCKTLLSKRAKRRVACLSMHSIICLCSTSISYPFPMHDIPYPFLSFYQTKHPAPTTQKMTCL